MVNSISARFGSKVRAINLNRPLSRHFHPFDARIGSAMAYREPYVSKGKAAKYHGKGRAKRE